MLISQLVRLQIVFAGLALATDVFADEPQDKPLSASPVCDAYCPKKEVSGHVKFVGSTTMQQLAAYWSSGFRHIHPKVQFDIDCRGSETALPSLAIEPLTVGLVSRQLTEQELQQLESDLGHQVVALTVCHDTVGIVVHPDNPLPSLNWSGDRGLLTVDNGASVATTWGDLKLDDPWSSIPIKIHGPDQRSGTRTFLEQLLFGSATPANTITSHPSRADVVKAVAADRAGIGLVSISRELPEAVRLVPIGTSHDAAVAPTHGRIYSRQYPLMRPLNVLIPMRDTIQEDPLAEEFTAYLLSNCGQQDAVKEGFVPLSRTELHIQEEQLGSNRLQ